ncbi:glyoxalase [Affinibrenneria salicis]|uniref:Glyoxalase n=1 Tax=Affinibrenneria salicis TaxID=2590031 RepID=A0A5J5G1N0_9GAMM|nr:glyoxalase [Affinibrenneria salicis]KAA9000585.1 glyoxalase [Affinibrenneria salicis]
MSIPQLNVRFVAGFGPVVRSQTESSRLWLQALGLPLQAMPGNEDYLLTDRLDGVKHFSLWPLAQASQSCFGRPDWPETLPEPQCWLELEVDDVAQASRILQQHGYQLLIENRLEPWGQTVSRFLSPEGILTGVTYTPWLREDAAQ